MPERRRHIASSACNCFSIASSSSSLTTNTISIPHGRNENSKNIPSVGFVTPGGMCIGAGSAPFNMSFSWSCSRPSNSFFSSSYKQRMRILTNEGIREGATHLIKISSNGSSRNLILDLGRKLCLFLNVRHDLVDLVNRARNS